MANQLVDQSMSFLLLLLQLVSSVPLWWNEFPNKLNNECNPLFPFRSITSHSHTHRDSLKHQQQHHYSKSIAWNVMSNYIQCQFASPARLNWAIVVRLLVTLTIEIYLVEKFLLFFSPLRLPLVLSGCCWCNSETDEKQKWWLGK